MRTPRNSSSAGPLSIRGESPAPAGSAAPARVRSKAHWLSAFALASNLVIPSLARAATRFVFATFKSDAVADEKLFTYESSDGLNFTLLAATGYSGAAPGTLRDPSIIRYFDGKYYVAYTNPQGAGCCGNEDHFSIAWSSDLVHWTELTTVKGDIANLAHVWAPEWFVEGSVVNIIANMDTGAGDFQQYLFTARDTSLTSWSGPVRMGIAVNHIDTFVLKVGGIYHAFLKSEATRFLEHATAAKLTGPWALVGKDDWAGWGSGMEGPSIVQLANGSWRMFVDPQSSTFFYTDSKDLLTWTKPVPLPGVAAVVRHGTVIADVLVGGTVGGAGGVGAASGGRGALASSGGAAAGETGGDGGREAQSGIGNVSNGGTGNQASGGTVYNAGSAGQNNLGAGGMSTPGGANANGGTAVGSAAAGLGALDGAAGFGATASETSTPTAASGCSCRVSGTGPRSNALWAVLTAGAWLGSRLRSRRRQVRAA